MKQTYSYLFAVCPDTCFTGSIFSIAMIDLALYRCRIGLFCAGAGGRVGDKIKDQGKHKYHKPSVFSPTNRPQSTKFNTYSHSSMELEENIVHSNSYFMHNNLYLCIILIFMLITSSFVCSPTFKISHNICPGVVYLKWDLSFITISQIKIGFFTWCFMFS